MIFPQYIVLFHYFRKLLLEANRRHIDIIPLKGAHLLTSVYPPDENRGLLADVDFLVRESDWANTIQLMIDSGFIRRSVPARAVSQHRFYEIGFYIRHGNGHAFLFEPHRQLVQTARHPIDYDAIWARSKDSSFDGAPCKRMTDDDHFLHQVIHLFTHRFTGLPRTFRDLELLMQNGEVDMSTVVSRAGEWKCRTALWLTLTLFNSYTKKTEFAPVLNPCINQIAPPAPVRLALTTLVSSKKGFLFAGTGLRKEEVILWPFLMDDLEQGSRFLFDYLHTRTADIIHTLHQKSDIRQ